MLAGNKFSGGNEVMFVMQAQTIPSLGGVDSGPVWGVALRSWQHLQAQRQAEVLPAAKHLKICYRPLA
jgi:hypothetical protein